MTDALVVQIASAMKVSGLEKNVRIAVGLSGGIDSVVLLHVLRRGLRLPPSQLSAIHVNHQISVHAASWATHCRRFCRELGVSLKVAKVEVPRGNSTEAAARQARHAVFAATPAAVIALAHNRDDQAETLMLQLLRGAGPRGLAAMPAYRPGVPAYWRPLLDVPRSAIEGYARRHHLTWVEDDSNSDRAYLRNFLRHDVLPVIKSRVPAADVILARAARIQAEASELLDQLAVEDLGPGPWGDCIPLNKLRKIPEHRARNALRYFLRGNGVAMPDASRLEESLRQALMARDDARVCVNIGDIELRRFREALYIVRPLPGAGGFSMAIRGRQSLHLPQLAGKLGWERRAGDGIAATYWRNAALTLKSRGSGERLRLHDGGPARTVRNLFQEAGIPPWQRERLPMIHVNGVLAAVPGVGVSVDFRPAAGMTGWFPVWFPD